VRLPTTMVKPATIVKPGIGRDCNARKAVPHPPFPSAGRVVGDCSQSSGAVDKRARELPSEPSPFAMRRQLQHGGVLTNAEMGQHTIWPPGNSMHVVPCKDYPSDLPETAHPVSDVPRFFLEKTQEKSVVLPVVTIDRDRVHVRRQSTDFSCVFQERTSVHHSRVGGSADQIGLILTHHDAIEFPGGPDRIADPSLVVNTPPCCNCRRRRPRRLDGKLARPVIHGA